MNAKTAEQNSATSDRPRHAVEPAISEPIETDQGDELPIDEQSRRISAQILKNAGSGSETILGGSDGTTPTSPPSEPPFGVSTKQWRKPRDAKGFASQANEVATMVLNGQIDLDHARVYSGVARTMAQVLSAEVYRARYLQQAPDLTFDEDT